MCNSRSKKRGYVVVISEGCGVLMKNQRRAMSGDGKGEATVVKSESLRKDVQQEPTAEEEERIRRSHPRVER
eukprot:CAMPEP_0119009262 /NCGR_PEP_ID=MMETSP1176-20130426/4246_1 /TAXON_ID=265551 /ORGANISM="Synedropsis recta cf, Strain CCMP1620" /LENGTH=71 /DNA_ID=CAMNT_0006961737 /DNA_START=292 /DNA_END=507 /DNA_ORIENTATION=-